ncbi:MAG: hypothetical protein JO101_00445 [Candidatus Eremiobacteraeota bacterium]|nr:hypothetical protein [Candidatus Eremiobacteraeota bacterium]MBV8353762.1 hypothetical protein [Candidatus Eremiobacteraeota bacterium]
MPLTELQAKEALRAATDWLFRNDPPGAFGAREGIANVIPLISFGEVQATDLDDLAAAVEKYADAASEEERAQLKAAVKAAFDHVKASAGP